MTTNHNDPSKSDKRPSGERPPAPPATGRTNPPPGELPNAASTGKESDGNPQHTALSPEAPGTEPIDPIGALSQGLQDRYRLLSVLGKGGFANVYLAHDKVLDQKVAIKILKLGQAKANDHKRFLMEARVGAKLRHPNIAQVFDIVQTPEGLQMIMEYYPEGTLSERIKKEGALPPRDAVNIARQVALALAHAHSGGVIHRDVKPANIFLGARGEAKLGDFGIAVHGEEHEYTKTGMVIGTPLYMAPEQSADSRDVDPRADIYALGLTLYHMLTGRPPRVMDLDTIPGPFRPVIRQSTIAERNQRLVSAEQFIAMLDSIELNPASPVPAEGSALTVMEEEPVATPPLPTQTSVAQSGPSAQTMATPMAEGENTPTTGSFTTQNASGVSKWVIMIATLVIAIPLFTIAITLLVQQRSVRQPGMAPVNISLDDPDDAILAEALLACDGDRPATGPLTGLQDRVVAPLSTPPDLTALPIVTPDATATTQPRSTPRLPSLVPVKEAFDQLRQRNRSVKIAMQLMLETEADAPLSIRQDNLRDARRRLIDEIKKTPENPLLHLLLGYSYNKAGYADDARREVQKAVIINRGLGRPIALDDRQALREIFGYKEGEEDIFSPPRNRPLP